MKLMLDCKDLSGWLSRALDEDIPAADRARMRLHLVMCETCRNVEEQLAFMRRAMQALGRERPDDEAPGPPKTPPGS